MLQLDLRHYHRGEIQERRGLGGRRLPRLRCEDAERSGAIAVAGDQWRTSTEAGAGVRLHAIGIIRVCLKIFDDQELGGLRDLRARRLFRTDAGMVETRDLNHCRLGSVSDLAATRSPKIGLAMRVMRSKLRLATYSAGSVVQRTKPSLFVMVEHGDFLRVPRTGRKIKDLVVLMDPARAIDEKV